MVLFSATALIVVALDQLSKAYVRSHLLWDHTYPVIPHVLSLVPITNTGAAFGLFKAATPILAAFGVVATVVVVVIARRARGIWPLLAYGLLLGGILGNLIGRLRTGYVTDFIRFPHFAVFNLADSAITAAVGILVITQLMRGES